MRALSLFAGIGVAEAYLNDIGIHVAVASELIKKRADLYSKIYPQAKMICGDIIDSRTYNSILTESKKHKIEIIMATPPCQGMSRAAGIPEENDERNNLIVPVIDIVADLEPKYVLIENVKRLLEVEVNYRNKKYKIPTLIDKILGSNYRINIELINTKNYSVAQSRERAIILLTRSDCAPVWDFPAPSKKVVTLADTIADLPILDPYISDISERELLEIFPLYQERKTVATKISRWHTPPHHIKRQVITMIHTPTGKTAFDNNRYYPRKKNGDRVRGYKSTYRRLNWDRPASTVTMDNRKISSQNNVHPGQFIGENENGERIYSDPRALTTYELMRVMSLPEKWPVPVNTPEPFLRSVMGEGIPPLFIKKVFEKILK